MQSAIPKAEVAFPTFKVALGRHNHGKLLARLTLQRRHRERPCRRGNHAADRNDPRAALDFVDHTQAFRAFNESLEGVLEHRFCLSRDGHFLFPGYVMSNLFLNRRGSRGLRRGTQRQCLPILCANLCGLCG